MEAEQVTETKHDIAMATEFVQGLRGGPPSIAKVAKLLMRARTELPSPGRDVGPWSGGCEPIEEDGKRRYRYFVESNDFTHDVRLYIDGDFADARQRCDYADSIAAMLNAGTPKVDEPSPPELKDPALRDIIEFLPPFVAEEEVRRIRAETGDGMMTVKAKLERKRTKLMIDQYAKTPVPALLAHILQRLLGKTDDDGY